MPHPPSPLEADLSFHNQCLRQQQTCPRLHLPILYHKKPISNNNQITASTRPRNTCTRVVVQQKSVSTRPALFCSNSTYPASFRNHPDVVPLPSPPSTRHDQCASRSHQTRLDLIWVAYIWYIVSRFVRQHCPLVRRHISFVFSFLLFCCGGR